MRKRSLRKENSLDLVPNRVSTKEWMINDEGKVQIIIPRNGLLDRMVRLIRNTPKSMKIDLDDYGSYVWQQIDGRKTVSEIGESLKIKYGEDVEPLYERLVTYIKILRNNKFIHIR